MNSTRVQEMSNARLYDVAPSIFAERPYEKVSDKYAFVPTIQVVDHLRDTGWVPVEAKQSSVREVQRSGFQRHMVRFVLKEHLNQDLMVNHNMAGVRIYNAHDGYGAFHGVGDILRKVCSNGLIVSDQTASFKQKHMGFTPEMLIHKARELAGKMQEVSNMANKWKAIEMSPDDQGVFAKTANNMIFGENSNIRPAQLLTPRRYGDGQRNDLWVTYNKIQENIMKGGLAAGRTKTGRLSTTREIKAIDREKKINQLLWWMTEAMEMRLAA